jgi:hypothetical protein
MSPSRNGATHPRGLPGSAGQSLIHGGARLSRAGDLTAVWVPDERHEAMRGSVIEEAASPASDC